MTADILICNKYSIRKVGIITVSCLIHCHPLLWKQLSRELCNSWIIITKILFNFSSNNIKISAVKSVDQRADNIMAIKKEEKTKRTNNDPQNN
jgi:hypothetical protein